MTQSLSLRHFVGLKILELSGLVEKQGPLASVDSRGGWWPVIRESYTGAFQQNTEVSLSTILTHPIVYACISLISSDIAKMRMRLVQQDEEGIWTEVENPAFSPVLREPNRYQTQTQFFERWLISKLVHGNTYVLKQRDNRGGEGRGVVTGLYLLDPTRTRPLVAPDGSVFYELKVDNLAGNLADTIVPASEVIHDRICPLYHDLVGISPITACGLAATQGVSIQDMSALFFGNGSTPGGIIEVPGPIKQEQITQLKTNWESSYGGANQGRVAVLGDKMQYKPINMMSATDSQLTEQLDWTSRAICSAFLVPGYKVGVGPAPTYNNIQALNTEYFQGCLQRHVIAIEGLLDKGLGLSVRVNGTQYGTEFDRDDLLMMDTAALISSEKEATGFKSPNESRRRLNLPKTEGGNSVFRQQQDTSLAAIAKRDEMFIANPMPQPAPIPPPTPQPEPAPEPAKPDPAAAKALLTVKLLERLRAA